MDAKQIQRVGIVLLISGFAVFAFSMLSSGVFSSSGDGNPSIGNPSSSLNDVSLISGACNVRPLVVKPYWEVLDQEVGAEHDGGGYVIHHTSGWGCNWVAQSFYNDGEPMTGFQSLVYIKVDDDNQWEFDDKLYIGVSTSLTYKVNDWLVSGSIEAHQLQPDVKYWVGLDFSDNPLQLNSGETAYIIAVSMDDWDDHDMWVVGGNYNESVYDRGSVWVDGNADDNWQEKPHSDLCFRTYTSTGSNGGEKPLLSISSENWVVTQLASVFMMLGGFIATTRPYWGKP